MLDGISFDQLQVFVRVTESGSFSAAARELHRAQSAVSYAIKSLEEELGVELFDRSSRRPTLTPAGQDLLSDVKAVEAQVGVLRRRANIMASGMEASVAVVLDSFLPQEELFPSFRRFEEAFPSTQLVLHFETLGAVPALIDARKCVIGFSSMPQASPASLVQQEVGNVEMAMVVGSAHELASECVIAVEELYRHAQVVVTDRSSLTTGKDHGVFSSRTWRVADPRTKLALVEAGFGYGSLPSHMCKSGLSEGRLALLRMEGRESGRFHLPVSCLWRRDQPPGPAGNWLRNELGRALTAWSTSAAA